MVQSESITNKSDISDIINQDLKVLMEWIEQLDLGDLHAKISERTQW